MQANEIWNRLAKDVGRMTSETGRKARETAVAKRISCKPLHKEPVTKPRGNKPADILEASGNHQWKGKAGKARSRHLQCSLRVLNRCISKGCWKGVKLYGNWSILDSIHLTVALAVLLSRGSRDADCNIPSLCSMLVSNTQFIYESICICVFTYIAWYFVYMLSCIRENRQHLPLGIGILKWAFSLNGRLCKDN